MPLTTDQIKESLKPSADTRIQLSSLPDAQLKAIKHPVIRFMRAACRLVDAHVRVSKHEPGTHRAKVAWENHDACDMEFDEAYRQLDIVLEYVQAASLSGTTGSKRPAKRGSRQDRTTEVGGAR